MLDWTTFGLVVGNYVIPDAVGRGSLAGYTLNMDNIAGGWYGEGDDMLFVDGEAWPRSIHGTGTEEIFGGGACPNTEYAGPCTGTDTHDAAFMKYQEARQKLGRMTDIIREKSLTSAEEDMKISG